MDSINDSEIQIPGFSLVQCDRLWREGGGVCIYDVLCKEHQIIVDHDQLTLATISV